MKRTAIVILNYNGRDYLEKFLPSVVRFSNDAEIIVADNASTDDSIVFLQQNYPLIRLIHNNENGGFAKGYNDALAKVKADYFLLLNSDIEVTEDWLTPLVQEMEDETVAGCQPKVLSYRNKSHFEHAGASGGFMDHNFYPFCRGRILEQFEKDNGQYDGETEIFWATGAALMIRADLFKKVGGFDEAFFAHMEEIDLCWRLKKMNYRFKVVPSSKIYHVGGGTLAYNSPRKLFLNFRNSLYMIVRNYEGWLFPKLFYRMCLDGVAAFHFLVKGEIKSFYCVFKAHYFFYRRLDVLLKQRKAIKETSTIYNNVGFYRASILWARYFKRITKFSDLNSRFFITDKDL